MSSDFYSQPVYDWLYFAARAGQTGREWAAEYRRHTAIVESSIVALELLRQGDLAGGKAALEQFAASVGMLPGIPVSMQAVMGRWYHGVAAYYFYRIGEFGKADEAMCLAHDAVAQAISESEFLLMLSVHCQEFCLHQARIARNRGQWAEMDSHIAQARAMMKDEQPLCAVADGSPVFFSTLENFFRSLEPLSPEEQQAIRGLTDKQERQRLFDRFVRRLVRLPEFAISYP
jgi:hypothetical protein